MATFHAAEHGRISSVRTRLAALVVAAGAIGSCVAFAPASASAAAVPARPTVAAAPADFFDTVTPNEDRRWCLKHIRDCQKVHSMAEEAEKETAHHFFESTWHNGKGDAFRHCYWSAQLAEEFGKKKAKAIGDRHERAVDGPAVERDMDQRNNAIGREVGVNRPDAPAGVCEHLADNNGLWVVEDGEVVLSGYSPRPEINPR